jgi:hypothetical protein
MTQFDITYTDFKREDTTNDITIKLYADNKRPIIPDASHTWKAKVAKDDKYVGEYPVTILGNTIKLSSSNLTRLPDGNYALELWETYDGSTAIYPSTGVMAFRVNKNLDDTLGTIDPTTDINGIIDDLHKAGQNIKVVATNTLPAGSKASVTQSITNGENQLTFNIPQGDKGAKGDVGPAPTLKIGTVTKLNPDQAPTVALTGDNGSYTLDLGIPQGVQGETNATATNALNVANGVNAKVDGLKTSGRNYIKNSQSFTISGNGTDNYDLCWSVYDDAFFANPFCNGTNKTRLSFDLTPSKAISTAKTYLIRWRQAPWTAFGKITVPANTTDKQHYELVTTTPTAQKQTGQIFIRLMADSTSEVSYTIENSMLTIGDAFAEWQPAPEDIQTQLDTLKEAVKKLGGDNLAPLVAPVMSNVGAETESVTHGHAQRFVLPLKGTELLPKTNILVDVLSGDTLSQSFVIETDATSVNGIFTFFMTNSSSHHIVPFNVQQLTATKYLVSARYTTSADGKWRILDIIRLNLTGGTYVEFSNPYAVID